AGEVADRRTNHCGFSQSDGLDWVGAVEVAEGTPDNYHICQRIRRPKFSDRVEKKSGGSPVGTVDRLWIVCRPSAAETAGEGRGGLVEALGLAGSAEELDIGSD